MQRWSPMAQSFRHPGESLSDLIERGPRSAVVACAALYHLLLYGLANRYPTGPATVLQEGWLDRAAPLWPWTIWIYASAHLLVVATFWSTRAPGARTRFGIVFAVIIPICVLVHWAWPIRFPRELYPLEGGGAGVAFLRWLRDVDRASSAFPSLHVAMVVVSALQAARERMRWAPAIALWAAAVSVSTMTTKQHYAVDVAAGVALALAVDWVVASMDTRGRQRRAYATVS
jgi:membrane-associated phospholipid phosphatase